MSAIPQMSERDTYPGYNYTSHSTPQFVPYNGSTYGGVLEDGTYVQIAHTTGGGGRGLFNDSYYILDTGTIPTCGWNESGLCNITSFDNFTTGNTSTDANPFALWEMIILGTLAGGTSLVTILGNSIVIVSFIIERTIRQPTNYFIASLAVSDLLLGSVSMPFYTVYLLAGKKWPLGPYLCDLWLSMDYTVCMTSIYTVFCITLDRFCMVKIPAKYRNWRTPRKVSIMVAMTWVIPVLVFFTTIFGWQYFVGERTVPGGMCYVQYMEEALFNFFLQFGYFWVTLVVMCVLYTGIYKVALNLQKKSEAKQKKMTSLVSMAGQSMAKIGIGMSKQQPIDNKKLFPVEAVKKEANNTQTLSTTSFSSGTKVNDKDEDRSSSPAFPSDEDPSSQDPNLPQKSKQKKKKTKSNHHSKHNNKNGGATAAKQNYSNTADLKVPGKNQTSANHNHEHALLLKNSTKNDSPADTNKCEAREDLLLPQNDCAIDKYSTTAATPTLASEVCTNDTNYNSIPASKVSGICNPSLQIESSLDSKGSDNLQYINDTSGSFGPVTTSGYSTASPANCNGGPKLSPPGTPPKFEQDLNLENVDLKLASPSNGNEQMTSYANPSDGGSLVTSPCGTEQKVIKASPPRKLSIPVTCDPSGTVLAVTAPPELLSGVRYIDQESLNSQKSSCDNIRLLPEPPKPTHYIIEEPGSPIWKKRNSVIERELRQANRDNSKIMSSDVTKRPLLNPGFNNTPCMDSIQEHPQGTLNVESEILSENRFVSKLTKTDEIQSLNVEAGGSSSRKNSKKDKHKHDKNIQSPFKSVVKVVSRRTRRKSKKEKDKQKHLKSKSENRARKALRTITIILGAFVLCWTPWHILSMIIGFCPPNTTCVHDILYDISYWLCYLNSPINPFCYAFANQQFKKTFLRILRFDWHRT